MRCIHESFAGIAKISPHLDAVVMAKDGASVSYDALLGKAVGLSRCLSPVETVALMSARTVDSVILLQAVSIAGGSLLPLATWEEARGSGMKVEVWRNSTEYALREGCVRKLVFDKVSDDFLITCAEKYGIEMLKCDEFIAGSSVCNETTQGGKSEVVLKLLSGGSTGSPKLHAITHEMMISEHENYRYIMDRVGCRGPWRVLQQSPAVWPASQFGQINIAIALAGTLVIAEAKPVKELAEEIERFSVNLVGGSPSQLGPLAEYLSEGYPMKVMFSWGESLNRNLGKNIKESFPRTCVIELLVATEYWLSMFCTDLSGKFERVPNCRVEVEDKDSNGVGQLKISGPMVGSEYLITQDLIRVSCVDQKIEFVGRKDFMTKVGANWFDVRELEAQISEAGQWMIPRISECVVVSIRNAHSVVLSLEQDSVLESCDPKQWLAELKGILNRLTVTLDVRTVASPLPKTASGKIDRKAIISLIESSGSAPHIAIDQAKSRFKSEFYLQTKWAFIFFLLLRSDALFAPFMYLATLYLPRSDYLPRSRVYSSMSSFFKAFDDWLRNSVPFGVSGAIVLVSLFRKKSRFFNSVFRAWTVIGLGLAALGGGSRLLAWPLAFWTGAGSAVRSDCSYWLSCSFGKWKRLFKSIIVSVGSVPDILLGTDFCAPFDETQHGETEFSTTTGEEQSGLELDEEETVWWKSSPVEYIRLNASSTFKGRESVGPPAKIEFASIVLTSIPGLSANMTSSLKGLSSLQVTELVQRLRQRFPSISTRSVMDSSTVQDLVESLNQSKPMTERESENRKKNELKKKKFLAKVQFSPGQINRPCRWVIRASKRPFDRTKLEAALEALTDRHALLRSELVDPKPLHSFLYDAAVMVVNLNRIFGPSTLIRFFARAVHACWVRLCIYPPGTGRPRHWVDVLSCSKASDFESLRRSIVAAKRDLEDVWNTRQRPLTAQIFTLPEGPEYLLLSIKHSVSDGNSAFPLMDELALLYENNTSDSEQEGQQILPEQVDPVPELEARLKAGILTDISNPNRTSLRTQLFYSKKIDSEGGGFYRHYLCFEKSATGALGEICSSIFEIGFDAGLLSVLVVALMRADGVNKQTITLYSPMRDGANESGIVGLLADWRDLTVETLLPGSSILDVFMKIAEKIRNRDWQPTLSPGGPESVLLNWLAFDGSLRLSDKSWEPYHLDKITNRWNRMDQRDFDARSTPSGRFRSMSLEQYEAEGEWWLRIDVAMKLFPPNWMMRFSRGVNDVLTELLNNPLQPCIKPSVCTLIDTQGCV